MKNQRIIPRLHILNRLNLLRVVLLEGTVERSVVSRRVHLHQGSEVRSSLLFPGVVIHENAIVEHAILDKGVEVAAGVTIRGTEEAPVVVKKGTIVTEDIV